MYKLKRQYQFFIIYLGPLLILNSCSKQSSPQAPPDNATDLKQIISATNPDTLITFVRHLSGEVVVTVGGDTATIRSRHKDYPGNDLAADYIEQKLLDYGLIVVNQEFAYTTPTGRNIYALQIGNEYPDHKYIICAHYDSMPDSSLSPGADDNASGAAAVLEAARIPSQLQTKYSVIYAFWDEEEQGSVGSRNYARLARQSNEQILGVINVDMIGWDSNNDGRIWINVRDTSNSVMIVERMVQLHQTYQLGMSPQVLNPGSGSDNILFWRHGYSAIGVEEMYGEDWNEYYHTTGDRLSHFNLN